jgi:hypothetical protein
VYSALTTIKAANKPLVMATPVTTVDSAAGALKITWTEPDTYGDPVTSYVIEIYNKAQNNWITGACDGSSPASKSCTVSMLSLGTSPYNYVRGDLIRV